MEDKSILSPHGNVSENLSKEDFVNELQPLISNILQTVFPHNPPKQKIRVHHDRISFAAPCCGDSASNNYKKRGNIILEGKFKNLYKCFNCGTCMSLQKFLKTYGQNPSIDIIDYIATSKDSSSFVKQTNMSYIYNDDEIDKYAISRDHFRSILNLQECSTPCQGRNYLISRKQYNFDKFLYSSSHDKLFVLNLTKTGKIFGMQVRSFGSGSAKYKTYNLQKLHQIILNDDVVIPDDINTLSMIFNILLIDCNKPVTVTEGPMDSFLIKNSIALCGAGKNMDFPFMIRYLFDDDKTGREHAIEKLHEGYEVFLWDSFKKDIGIVSRGKLDYNDVVMWCSKENKVIPNLDQYFSDDEMELINL